MDALIPYMAEVRHQDDQLFFVAEQDFRFSPEDENPLEFVNGNADLQRQVEDACKDEIQPNEKDGTLNMREPTDELIDLVRLCTMPHRWRTTSTPNTHGHGDMVWLSWSPFLLSLIHI